MTVSVIFYSQKVHTLVELIDNKNARWNNKNSFKQLLSYNVKLQLYRTTAISFKQLQFHKTAQRQLHSSSRDGLRQIQFTVNQAARTLRPVFAIAFETAHFHAWRRFWTFVSFFQLRTHQHRSDTFSSSDISTVIDKIVAALVCGEAWNLFYQTSCM